MSQRTLTATEVAAELGRTRAWLYQHWRELVTADKLPVPVAEGQCLAWNAAQFYAWLDRNLTTRQRAAACAYRAALLAYNGASSDADPLFVAERRDALNQKFGAGT